MNLQKSFASFLIIIIIPITLFNCTQKPVIKLETSSPPTIRDSHDLHTAFAWINQAAGHLDQVVNKTVETYAFQENAKKCLSGLKKGFELLPHSYQIIGDSLSILCDNIHPSNRSEVIGITLVGLILCKAESRAENLVQLYCQTDLNGQEVSNFINDISEVQISGSISRLLQNCTAKD